ncbi:nucleotide pyrophosphohydrolase [Thermococcus guaymasensis DSM 11113]|uniref:Nucleotide pyrophosphohydrolase n=1 Tax=Thermococcus guaymasensis DSM 11113 TaxID=1432656 RepID=A0A0X1KJV8_9EURY|nr:nucleotide pyrophosphohydrolase [Thermococcus guaymasensis]AJC71525.1 nucleotide pyrophosphohydrolase [Thermococcus guaymasensis DSM 11113]
MATIHELTSKIVKFRDERDWNKYHTPRNLAISLVVELGELLEHFQWKNDDEILKLAQKPDKREKIEEELADVAIYLFLLANELSIDLETAILNKIKKNEEKYPVDLVKGKYVKYTELRRK